MTAQPLPPHDHSQAALNRALAKQHEFASEFLGWLADDSGEQEETWDLLRVGLEQSRRELGMRPLFRRSGPRL